jgi:hypothetical protein
MDVLLLDVRLTIYGMKRLWWKRYFRAAMHKFHPFKVVFKKVIKGRGWYVNPGAVCERNCHFHLLIVVLIQ